MNQHHDPEWFRNELSESMQAQLEQYKAQATQISPQSAHLVEAIQQLVTGGKRLRALLAWWGWQAAGGDANAPEIINAGVALELFQAAALIHDDILDRSDTRRGQPAVHRRFQKMHEDAGWQQDAGHFGVSAAILAGDLALALSEEVFASAADATAFAGEARTAFNTMRFEVMTGQYLDVLAESDVDGSDPDSELAKARQILKYKSAHYSTVWPFALGGTLAGADEPTLLKYREFSEPLGIAFQLRDDILGVFGDPALTGKPAGDDLREGKRTEMIAHALMRLSEQDAQTLNDKLGAEDLSDTDVAQLQQLLVASDAKSTVDSEIQEQGDQALKALEELMISPTVREGLLELTDLLLHREH